jgi:hypothetical protein
VLAKGAEDGEHGGDVGFRGKVGLPVCRFAAGEDEEEAFEQTVLLFAAESMEQEGLDAADDGDDRVGDEPVVGVGEDIAGPEGEIALAVFAGPAVDGLDESDEFVAVKEEAGGVREQALELGPGGLGGDERGEGDDPFGFLPLGVKFGVEEVERLASGDEGRGLAGAGEGDEGNPEGRVFGPAGLEVETEAVADDGAGAAEEGHGGHDRRDASEGGGVVEPGFDRWRQEVGRETGGGREGRGFWFRWGEKVDDLGKFGEGIHGCVLW